MQQKPYAISLGKTCLPRFILNTEVYGVHVDETDFTIVCPFDFNITPYEHLLTILDTDMACLKRQDLRYVVHPWFPNKTILVQSYENWLWPNEVDLVAEYGRTNIPKLLDLAYEHMRCQYRYFKETVESRSTISFLIDHRESPIPLAKLIARKFPHLTFQLVVFNHTNNNISESEGIRVIDRPFPGNNKRYQWWSEAHANSVSGKKWQTELGAALKLILTEFEEKPG